MIFVLKHVTGRKFGKHQIGKLYIKADSLMIFHIQLTNSIQISNKRTTENLQNEQQSCKKTLEKNKKLLSIL